jgi:hypothetical protein
MHHLMNKKYAAVAGRGGSKITMTGIEPGMIFLKIGPFYPSFSLSSAFLE